MFPTMASMTSRAGRRGGGTADSGRGAGIPTMTGRGISGFPQTLSSSRRRDVLRKFERNYYFFTTGFSPHGHENGVRTLRPRFGKPPAPARRDRFAPLAEGVRPAVPAGRAPPEGPGEVGPARPDMAGHACGRR